MEKINWNKKRTEWAENMNPSPIWNEGTDDQQEFADNLVTRFCKNLSKYLCLAVQDNLITISDAENIVNSIFYAINDIDNAKWWCNKKNSTEFSIALKLLEDNDSEKELIKKIQKSN